VTRHKRPDFDGDPHHCEDPGTFKGTFATAGYRELKNSTGLLLITQYVDEFFDFFEA